jgi:hypothetical protein
METTYWIARLRALLDNLRTLAEKAGDAGIEGGKAYSDQLQSGKSLGYSHAADLVRELAHEFIVDATKSQRH